MAIIINFVFCTAIFLLAVVKDIFRVALVLCMILLSGRNMRRDTPATIKILVENVITCYKKWKEDIA